MGKNPQGDYLYSSLEKTLERISLDFGNSSDLIIKNAVVMGKDIGIVMCEGMASTGLFSEGIMLPILEIAKEDDKVVSSNELFERIKTSIVLLPDQKVEENFSSFYNLIMSGYVGIIVDGLPKGLLVGLQGYSYRGVGEVTTEANVRGSKEGFVENLKVNQTLIRRRLKSPKLRFINRTIGSKSNTLISICYLEGAVSQNLLNNILREIELELENMPEIVLNSGYLRPYLERKPYSLFGGTGITERPDNLCAKIGEGRVGIIVDGTPFALIVPYLFTEHFQSMDDYAYRSYFALFLRLLKLISFFASILLPGIYVACVSFHPELIPEALLFNIASAEETTPFPIIFEAILINILYEIMREAGLRLPKEVGHAVSIVGAIVIGDAAVSAGLASAPMVMVVALTAISAFAVQSLYEEICVLKFLFIIAGGMLGFFGIAVLFCVVVLEICSVNCFGLPFSSPLSPFSFRAMGDVLIRLPWRSLAKSKMKIENLRASEVSFWRGDEENE